MELGQATIRGVLASGKQYQIPLFQRSYSWERPQWLVLLMDVLDQYRVVRGVFDATDSDEARNATLQGIASHYLGTLVQADPSAVGLSRVKLIDGQQRLSTISIAICALRDRLRERLGASSTAALERTNQIDVKFVIHPGETGDERYRLLPQRRDRRAYQAITESTRSPGRIRASEVGLSESDSDAMLKAYNFFFRAWNEVPSQLEDYADLYPLDLDAALVALTDRLYVVSIEATSSTDNVNAIFESLNTKGRALRQVDLLKNFLFLNLGSDAERVLRDSWHPIEDLLDPGEVEHFVWAYMVSQGTYSLQNRTYETIQRQLRGRAEEIEKFVNSLKESASLFDRIIHPDKEPNPIIRREFVDLHQAGNLVWIPMALYCYRRFYSAELDVDALVDALSRIESFLVRRMLCDLSPNNLNSMLGSMLAKLRTSAYRETEDLAADIGRILASRPGDWPTDQDLETRIVSTPFYLRQSTAQRIHVLRKLDAKFSQSGVTPNYEISDSSIEHIAPQNRESITWREDLGPQDWVEVQEELLHTLGNLTLLTPALNSKLGDGQWDTKRAAYREAGYPMTETLGSSTHDRWGPSQIRERSVELANIAKEVWPRLAVPPHEVVAGESAVLAEDLDEEPVSDAELDEGWAEILAVHDDSGEE